jgi:hypothetical protein
MRTVFLVPRRDGFAERDRIWAWTKAWWRREFPEFEMIEGHHDGPDLFNRSKALNRASATAGDWDMAVIIDSDVITDPGHVREAIATAAREVRMVVPFTVRHNLNRKGSERIMAGDTGPWEHYVARDYLDQHSAVIVVPRSVWDTVGGFDETFSGWGMEDTAFAIAVTTLVGPLVHMPGECWHFYHPSAPEGHRGTPSAVRNRARGARYQAAMGDAPSIRAILAEQFTEPEASGIPRIFHRVVPEHTTDDVERWWTELGALHPGWRFMTHRDPLDPVDWPETAAAWKHCRAGASLADLVRLEALWRWGGIYVDSDVEPFRSFEPLLPLEAFAAWEDAHVVPNAIMGARPGHPAIRACLDLAVRQVRRGVWEAGPGVTTRVLPNRNDVLLLPPGSLYPVHYRDPERQSKMADKLLRQHAPWAFALHHYAGSWLKKDDAA